MQGKPFIPGQSASGQNGPDDEVRARPGLFQYAPVDTDDMQDTGTAYPPAEPAFIDDPELRAREQVVKAAQDMAAMGLSPGRSGNVSARIEGEAGAPAMVITPTGIPYVDLTPASIVRVEPDGSVAPNQLKPSSEWHFHLAIYKAYGAAGGIVHTHSQAATALACTHRRIPAFHYMVAIAGGADIRCAEYATFGTPELADAVVQALDGRWACLMANHGQVAYSACPASALTLAQEVETLAAQYVQVLSIGGGHILDTEEMARVLEKFGTYGQQEDED